MMKKEYNKDFTPQTPSEKEVDKHFKKAAKVFKKKVLPVFEKLSKE